MISNEQAEAWYRLRKAMNEIGLALIDTEAMEELVGYTDDVDCPICAGRTTVTIPAGEEGVITECDDCGAQLDVQLVQYLSAV